MPSPNLITLSHPTYVGPSGATAAATYSFMTRGYKPAAYQRSLDYDFVHNQNGWFKYIYDNGPNFRKWGTFEIACEEVFKAILGATAAQQLAQLLEMWNHKGALGLQAPEGVFTVHWASTELEPQFKRFPVKVGDTVEYTVAVQFEET